MQDDTRLHLSTAINGLIYGGELINQALLGKKRGYHYEKSLHGPFAEVLTRIAEIADGAEITDMAATRRDMVYLFDLLSYLRGGFYDAAWSILKRAHALVADRIPAKEAATILGASEFMLDIEVRLNNLHSLEGEGGISYYARYEVEALKAKHDFVHARPAPESKAEE